MLFAAKLTVAAALIAFASWLADKKPVLAGFILALPLTTLLALAFNYVEFKDPVKSVLFARSVFAAVPLSLVFFLPFLFSERLALPFWSLYALGLLGLFGAYTVHSYIFS